MMNLKQQAKLKIVLTTAHTDFQKGLNARAYYKLNDHELGEDLVQNTFAKTWVYLVKGGKVDLMKAFLYHILNNLIIDEYRKKKPESLDLLLGKGFEPSVDEFDHILNALDGKKALLLIHRLPEKYQKIMRMHYVQDLSLGEMSLITGESKKHSCCPNTSRTSKVESAVRLEIKTFREV